MKAPSLTIGIEEEYQIIDPQTRELRSYITQILEEGKLLLFEQVKPELHQAMVEVGSNVCQTPAELRTELVRLRRTIMELAAKNGLKIVAAGTHPFSSWLTQEITPQERYMGVKQDMQELAQRLLIFGTHVHIGIEDREFLIDAMNVVRYLLPHILCLSTSSPFWMGRLTGLKSYRSIIFRNVPRSGIPRTFQPWEDYTTLEFRSCDVGTGVDEAICIAAIFQAIIAKLWRLRRDNMTFRVYPHDLIEENKWRAIRYGLDGKLIDFGKQQELPTRDLIRELIEWFIADVIDELGSRHEIEYAYRILQDGSSADRQLATYQKTGDLKAVVDQLIQESSEGVLESV